MTRLSRLTNILLHLQTRRVVTAQQLADKFDISQRTVYRDIRTLEEAGVPIISEAGKGYSLISGYNIPPVMFNEQEINALLTALQYLRKNSDKSVYHNLTNVVTKIKAIIRFAEKEKVEKLEERVRVYSDNNATETNFLTNIQSAILNCIVLKIKYHTYYSNTVSERLVEPIAVYLTKENWVMIAYCRLRKDLREFRFDRILNLITTSENFPDHHFTFEDYLNKLPEKS